MTYPNGDAFSDSVNLGSNPSPPATRNTDETGVSGNLSPSEKPEPAEHTAHTGRTKVGTAAVGSYGFTCGYCEVMLDTPYDDHDRASRYAQEQGWRMTFGQSPRWGDGANNTCPNCAEGDKDAIPIWVPFTPSGAR